MSQTLQDTRHPLEGTLEMLEKRVHKLAEHNSGDKGRGNNVDEGKLDSLVDEV